MRDGHPGVVQTAGPDSYAARLRRLHEAAMAARTRSDERTGTGAGQGPEGGATHERPRGVISASWRRCLAAGIDPETGSAPPAFEGEDIRQVRSAHPMSRLLPVITETLLEAVTADDQILLVTDAAGRVLWRDGSHRTMERADEVGLSAGFDWSETAIGTNGLGTALAARRPLYVFSAEHLVRALHVWSCSAAPIIDPDSGEPLGCVDVSGMTRAMPPASVALVEATARLAESRLTLRMLERDQRLRRRHDRHLSALRGEPGALVTATGRIIAGDDALQWAGHRVLPPETGDRVVLPDGRSAFLEALGDDGFLLRLAGRGRAPVLTLSFLGADHPSAYLDGTRLPLSLRHAEILAMLVLNPGGMTADQLSFHLYGDAGNPVTARAEIHRLRAHLGRAIVAKPYRLDCAVEADFVELKRLLATDETTAVARAYRGPLLPRSEAPALRREREELEGQVRARLLRRGGPEALWAYAETERGRSDVQILERLIAMLPRHDHRAVAAGIRIGDAGPP
ncbi:helix-turn-helix domain-containing protein [Streptosporangium longisporum]|uniref:GAF domain-containing protein n=1 Tax=Streptosporangium longisporum TaxID=46187 RepID=A0ABP6KF97_9ACTN